jgi:hypothetical protein
MTRDELLHLASQHTDPVPEATQMARRMTCADSVQSAATSLSQQAAALEKLAAVLVGSSVLSMVVAFVFGMDSVLTARPDYATGLPPATLVCPCALVVFFITASCYFAATDKAERLRKELALLKPVVSAKDCGRALEYLDAGAPEVQAWHALAIAERGVLAEFDVAVLRDIHYAAKAARADEAARQKLYSSSGRVNPPEAIQQGRRRVRRRTLTANQVRTTNRDNETPHT